jgi:hypothetical protein
VTHGLRGEGRDQWAAGSNDGVALLLEHTERTGPHGDEVALRVVYLCLGGRRPAGSMHDLTVADYTSLADRPEEVDVHLYSCSPHTHERQDREAHGVVYEGGVDTTVQRSGAVEVYVLDIYGYTECPGSTSSLGPVTPRRIGRY